MVSPFEVVNAIFMMSPFQPPLIPLLPEEGGSVLIMRQLLRFLCISLEKVGGLEHQVQRAAITGPDLLVSPQPVENRQTGAQVGADLQLCGRLTTVGVGHDQ